MGELAGAAFTKTRANEEEEGAETSGRKGLFLLSLNVKCNLFSVDVLKCDTSSLM